MFPTDRVFSPFTSWEDSPSRWAQDTRFLSSPSPPSTSRCFATDITVDPTIEPFSPVRPLRTSAPAPESPGMPPLPLIPVQRANQPVQAPLVLQSNTDRTLRAFPKGCRDQMDRWFREHLAHPYPPRSLVKDIAERWHVTEKQIRTFFVNQRTRYASTHPPLKHQWQSLAPLRSEIMAMQSE
jgi:hypothetical protein